MSDKPASPPEVCLQDVTRPMGGAIKGVCDRLAALLQAKNRDYGNSVGENPVFSPGLSAEEALWIRMGDKVKRICQLRAGNPEVVSESLWDSVQDLAGYCVLLLASKEVKDVKVGGEAYSAQRSVGCDGD